MTQTTSVSRLQLLHPDLGHPGGVDLHTHVATAWTKIGDSMNSRFFTVEDLANAASVDFEHNFKCSFSELKALLYSWNPLTDELTRIVTGGSPDLADFTIVATPGNLTTQIRVTNNTGSAQDIAVVLIQGKGAEILNDLSDVDTTGREDGQALVFSAALNKFIVGASGDSSFKMQSINSSGTQLVIKSGFWSLSDGRVMYLASDLTIDVSSIITSNGYWYVYIDTYSLPASTIVSGRKLVAVTSSNFTYSQTAPEDNDRFRYVSAGQITRSGGVFTLVTTEAYRNYDFPLGVDGSLVDSIDYTLIGAVGDVGQLNSGHQLATSSFPSGAIGANLSWYNLPDMNDDSGNGRTLTNNGAATFTTGILGDASQAVSLNGTTQYLSSVDSLFDPGDSDFSFGGWVKSTNWLAATIQVIASQWPSTGNWSYWLAIINSKIRMMGSVSGSDQQYIEYDLPSTFTGWHHISTVYTASDNTLKLYIDGVNVGSVILTGGLKTTGGSRQLNIGRNPDGNQQYFAGDIDEFFFAKYAMTDNDIMKIQAAKYAHNKGMSSNAQDWKWWTKTSTDAQRRLDYDPIISAETNELFFDLSQEPSTNYISRKLFNAGQSGLSKPIKGQTLTLTTDQLDAMLPITHNCGGVPDITLKVSNGTDYESQDWGSVFVVNSTQIKIAGSSLVTLFGTGVSVILTYSSGIPSTFVPNRFWNNRTATSAIALSVNDRVFADTQTTAAFTGTLPLSPNVGDEIQVCDSKGYFGTNAFTFGRNGQNIMGSASDFVANISHKMYRAVYVDATYGWAIYY